MPTPPTPPPHPDPDITYMDIGTGQVQVNSPIVSFSPNAMGVPGVYMFVQNLSGQFSPAGDDGPVVNLDTMEGSMHDHDLQRGHNLVRVAVVENLNLTGLLNTFGLVQAAEDAVIAIVGPRGTLNAEFTDVITKTPVLTYIASFSNDVIGATSVRVKINYKGYPLPQFEFGGCLGHIETNIDVNGDPIETSYTYPTDYNLDTRKAGLTIKQGGFASTVQSEPTFSVHWTVTAGALGDATQTMSWWKAAFEGLLNNAPYSIGYLRGDADDWLIEKVDGVTRDGALTYEAVMLFHLKPNGWDPLVTFINPDDGKPPPDGVEGSSYYNPQVIRSTGFPNIVFGVN